MRKNQVTISVVRVGDQVPEGYGESSVMDFSVYCDSNNFYEALLGAIHQVLSEVQKYEELPSFGSKDVYYRKEG